MAIGQNSMITQERKLCSVSSAGITLGIDCLQQGTDSISQGVRVVFGVHPEAPRKSAPFTTVRLPGLSQC